MCLVASLVLVVVTLGQLEDPDLVLTRQTATDPRVLRQVDTFLHSVFGFMHERIGYTAALDAFGFHEPHSAGAIGQDVQSLEQVLVQGHGNLREKLTLLYHIIYDHRATLTRQLLQGPGPRPLNRFEARVDWEAVALKYKQELESGDLELCRLDGGGSCKKCFDPLFVPDPGSPVRNCRCVSREFECRTKRTQLVSSRKVVLETELFPALSSRELKFQLLLHNASCPDLGPASQLDRKQLEACLGHAKKESLELSWRSGKDLWEVNLESRNPEVQTLLASGRRLLCGPSGTTQKFMMLGRYFSLDSRRLCLLRLAMIAWMVPVQDHTAHEILLGSVPYLSDQLHDDGRCR